MSNKNLEIKLLKDCWGSYSYFGYIDGKQYTEAYDIVSELKEQNSEFRNINSFTFKNAYGWILKLTDKENLLSCNSKTLDQLKQYNPSIYFNDRDSYHWIYDFKLSGVWFEANKINCINSVMEINAWN